MHNISETQLNPADVKAIFRDAEKLRNTPTGLGKIFKGLRKDKIEFSDLQQAWKDDNYSDDTADIMRILQGVGFSNKEINKVFANVLGKSKDSEEFEEPVASPVVQKIADYAKKEGLADDLIEFMRREYKFDESMSYPDKVMIEDIRQIFSSIIHEERSARAELIKKEDIRQLGRGKK